MEASRGAAEAVEAVVQVGRVEIRYRRAGRGRAVLLLTSTPGAERERVFRHLAATHLVIEPLALPAVEGWPEWLRGVVDGLGLDRPDLMVSRELAEAAGRFVEYDPGRAGRVVLIETIDG